MYAEMLGLSIWQDSISARHTSKRDVEEVEAGPVLVDKVTARGNEEGVGVILMLKQFRQAPPSRYEEMSWRFRGKWPSTRLSLSPIGLLAVNYHSSLSQPQPRQVRLRQPIVIAALLQYPTVRRRLQRWKVSVSWTPI